MDENPIHWTGDLGDDCSAEWNGFLLRAEWISADDWWWCVYDQSTGEQIASSNLGTSAKCRTGEAARSEAEKTARIFAAIK